MQPLPYRKPAQRLFPGLVGRPDPAPTTPTLTTPKRGRPCLAGAPMTAAERKRRQRAIATEKKTAAIAEAEAQARATAIQDAIAKTVLEQKIDQETGGRGAGMIMPQAPHGRGRIRTGGFGLAELGDADARDQRQTNGGKRWAPEGPAPDTRQQVPFAIPYDFKKRERQWANEEMIRVLIRSRYWCRYCPKPRPEFNMDQENCPGINDHIRKQHPEKHIPELGIVSIFQCSQCGARFNDYIDAKRHVSSLRHNHKRPKPDFRDAP